MTELRWILLLLGVLFVAGLFLWERRKQRLNAPGAGSAPPAAQDRSGSSAFAVDEEPAEWVGSTTARDAALILPEIRPREALQPLPVIEFHDDEGSDSRFDPDAGAAHAAVAAAAGETVAVAAGGDGEVAGDDSAVGQSPAPIPMPAPAPRIEGLVRPDPADLRLEWSDEPDRQILAIRVVPIVERFGGRGVRQALAGEGFVHGPLGIFHRALADGRVVLSCASLTKPGSFDLLTMDSQRYAGLNLFAVLPGPLAAAATLENLVTLSRTLAARLGGLVQDERGQPLDAPRIAELRARITPDGAPPSRSPAGPEGGGENASP